MSKKKEIWVRDSDAAKLMMVVGCSGFVSGVLLGIALGVNL